MLENFDSLNEQHWHEESGEYRDWGLHTGEWSQPVLLQAGYSCAAAARFFLLLAAPLTSTPHPTYLPACLQRM